MGKWFPTIAVKQLGTRTGYFIGSFSEESKGHQFKMKAKSIKIFFGLIIFIIIASFEISDWILIVKTSVKTMSNDSFSIMDMWILIVLISCINLLLYLVISLKRNKYKRFSISQIDSHYLFIEFLITLSITILGLTMYYSGFRTTFFIVILKAGAGFSISTLLLYIILKTDELRSRKRRVRKAE